MMLSVRVQERQLSLNKLLQSLNFRIWVRTQLGGGVQKAIMGIPLWLTAPQEGLSVPEIRHLVKISTAKQTREHNNRGRKWLELYVASHRVLGHSSFPEAKTQQLSKNCHFYCVMLLLLLSRFSHVRLYATPQMAAYQASLSLGFSRQEHWSGLPFPSPMHESEK